MGPAAMPVSLLNPLVTGPTQPAQNVGAGAGVAVAIACEVAGPAVGLPLPPPPELHAAMGKTAIASTGTIGKLVLNLLMIVLAAMLRDEQ